MKWRKDNGDEIETNDLPATVKHCESLGWECIDDETGSGNDEITDADIEEIAKACHDANRAYCKSNGDDSQPTWGKAQKWQKDSAMNGVRNILENPDAKPEDSHKSWLAEKEADGWKYGEVKDADKKEHPCFVPYDELSDEQKKKDEIFIETAKAGIEKLLG